MAVYFDSRVGDGPGGNPKSAVRTTAVVTDWPMTRIFQNQRSKRIRNPPYLPRNRQSACVSSLANHLCPCVQTALKARAIMYGAIEEIVGLL
jgi:hypothetical protein